MIGSRHGPVLPPREAAAMFNVSNAAVRQGLKRFENMMEEDERRKKMMKKLS